MVRRKVATEQLIWTWSSHAQHSILFYSSQKAVRVRVYVALQPNSFCPTRVGRNACSRHHQHASVDSYNSRFFTLISRRLSPVRTYSPKIGTDLEATPLATLDLSTHLSISSSSNPTHLMCVASQTTHTPTAFSSFSSISSVCTPAVCSTLIQDKTESGFLAEPSTSS